MAENIIKRSVEKSEILSSLATLTKFEFDKNVNFASFEDILKQRLSEVEALSSTTKFDLAAGDLFSIYIRILTGEFNLLLALLSELPSEKGVVFSVQEKRDISRSVEFLIGFGILPFLDSGVVADEYFPTNFPSQYLSNQREKVNIFFSVLHCLYNLWSNSELKSTISSQFLRFLLAALLQSTCRPNFAEENLKEQYENYLKILIDGTYRPVLIREFFYLQGPKSGKRAPSWLTQICGRFLSNFLTEKDGLFTLLHTVDDTTNNLLNDDWKKCDSLAALISSKPKNFHGFPRNIFPRNSEDYFTNICRQIYENDAIFRRFPRFYASAARKLFLKSPENVRKFILRPVLDTIFNCFREPENIKFNDENLLTETLEKTRLLFTFSPLENSDLRAFYDDFLKPELGTIFLHIFSDLENSVSNSKTNLKEILCIFFINTSLELMTIFLQKWMDFGRTLYRNFRFDCGSTGGVKITNSREVKIELQDRIEILFRLAESMDAESKNGFYEKLFDACAEVIVKNENSNDDERRAFFLLFISVAEREETLFMKKKSRVQKLLKALLEMNRAQETDDNDLNALRAQNLLLILGIIGALFAKHHDLTTDVEWTEIRELINEIGENHESADVRGAAKNLCFLFTTASFEKLDIVKEDSSTSSDNSKSKFDQAVRDLRDPLLPVRAHALVVLANLIKAKDVHARENIDSLIPVFLEKLQEDDSYVYLAAVNCLAEAGLCRPSIVLPLLLEVFKGNSNMSGEQRFKIGEAIVKISRGLGDLAPHYANESINAFLSLLRDGEPDIKCSCLCNIGEICRLLSFKLNSYIQELFYCAQQLIKWEKNASVRRAAAHLLALLSQNGSDFIEILDELALEFYRFVKSVYETDSDDVVRLHAQLCLENLGEHAERMLKPLISPLT